MWGCRQALLDEKSAKGSEGDALQDVRDEGWDEVAQRTGRRVVQAEATERSELGNEFGQFEGLWEDRLELSER